MLKFRPPKIRRIYAVLSILIVCALGYVFHLWTSFFPEIAHIAWPVYAAIFVGVVVTSLYRLWLRYEIDDDRIVKTTLFGKKEFRFKDIKHIKTHSPPLHFGYAFYSRDGRKLKLPANVIAQPLEFDRLFQRILETHPIDMHPDLVAKGKRYVQGNVVFRTVLMSFVLICISGVLVVSSRDVLFRINTDAALVDAKVTASSKYAIDFRYEFAGTTYNLRAFKGIISFERPERGQTRQILVDKNDPKNFVLDPPVGGWFVYVAQTLILIFLFLLNAKNLWRLFLERSRAS